MQTTVRLDVSKLLGTFDHTPLANPAVDLKQNTLTTVTLPCVAGDTPLLARVVQPSWIDWSANGQCTEGALMDVVTGMVMRSGKFVPKIARVTVPYKNVAAVIVAAEANSEITAA